MSDFEFLSVLISIVIGLGLTHLLAGLGRMFYFRASSVIDFVHIAWTIAVFFLLVLNWWVTLLWRDISHWTFAHFFTLIIWTSTFYILALALYPPNLPTQVDYRKLYESNRTWLMSTWTIMCLLDILVTFLREGQVPEPFYLLFVGHYAVITTVAIFLKSRTYDLVAAWYIALTMAAWSFGVRATLF